MTAQDQPADSQHRPHNGAVKGQAYQPAEVREALVEAWNSVAHIDREKAIVSRDYQRGRTVYVLDREVTEGLTAIQKAVLAHGGVPDWGGYVTGYTVTISTGD
jgi:hypothetical protein